MKNRKACSGLFMLIALLLASSCGKRSEIAELHYRAAIEYRDKEETDSALVELGKAIQADPKHIHANTYYQSLMQYELGKGDEVRAEYEAKLREHPNDPVYRYFVANLEDDTDRRLEMAQEVVALDPKFYEGILFLGDAYQRVGYDDDAVESWERAAALEPDRSTAYTRMAYMYLNSQEFGKAAELFRKIVKMDSSALTMHAHLWRAEYETDEDKEAGKTRILQELDSLLSRHPDHVSLLSSVTYTLRTIGASERAGEIEKRILELDSTGSYAQSLDYRQIYSQPTMAGRREAAEAFLKKYTKGNMRKYALQMLLMFAVQDPDIGEEEAESVIQRAFSEDPDNASMHNTVAWYYYLEKPGKAGKALEHATRAVELADSRIVHYYLDTQGWAYYKMGKYGEAVKVLLKADSVYQKLESPDNEVRYHLGAAYLKTGDTQKGLEYLCHSLALAENEETRTLFREAYQTVHGTTDGADEYLIRRALAMSAVEEPYDAPDFKLASLKGEEESFSKHAGKVVLINFWKPG